MRRESPPTARADDQEEVCHALRGRAHRTEAVSYTHTTLPPNREVVVLDVVVDISEKYDKEID